jgi:hypothetical protein
MYVEMVFINVGVPVETTELNIKPCKSSICKVFFFLG